MRGAGIDAGVAASTEAAGWWVGVQGLCGQEMADHHPRAPFGMNQIAVLADPAQAGFLSPGLVQ